MSGYKDSVKGTGTGMCSEIIRGIRGYGKCRDRLYFRLINTEKNRGLLEKTPHIEIMDLSMVCYVLMENTEKGLTSILVTGRLVGHWGVPAGEIMAQAVRNAPKILPIKVGNVLSILKEASMAEDTWPAGEDEKKGFFMMTNIHGLNGFGAVLYGKALKDFAELMGDNVYVIPSSIHEALLLPAGGGPSEDELRYMVRTVNETLEGKDILSDNVYFYDRQKNELRVTGKEGVCVKL